MNPSVVSVVKYEKPYESVARVVELCGGIERIGRDSKVFIKPNVVFWTKETVFPKWGVITTSRVVEDMVILLKEAGIDDITIGEGVVTRVQGDKETPAHAFEYLGYGELVKKYGVKVRNVLDGSFRQMDLGDGILLNFCKEAAESDYIVSLPVLKAHNQTKASLGIKNLKGLIDIKSRKKCHNSDPVKDLHYHVAKLADKMPPVFTLIDGIYSLEKGPGPDGRMFRKDILIASWDILGADKTGAAILGFDPAEVPYIRHAAENHGRTADLSDVTLAGEPIDDLCSPHKFDFPYIEDEEKCIPDQMAKMGMKGLFYRKFDSTMCTYCSELNGVVLSSILYAWQGEDFDRLEVLTGKKMKPSKGMKKTILLGRCMYQAHRDSRDINHMIAVKGCPPDPESVVKALHEAGIDVDKSIFDNIDHLPGLFMERYKNRPEFDESFFRVEQ